MRLDDTSRMNTPGKAEGNWAWRVGGAGVWEQLGEEAADLRRLLDITDRLPPGVARPTAGGRTGKLTFR